MARILLIEGDQEVAEQLSAAANAEGHETKATPDGSEGLDWAKEWQPELIVLCVELNRISGYSICNKLKKDKALADVPLILTSSQATDETFAQHQKLKTRADAYVHKPFEIPSMMGIMREYLGGEAPAGGEEGVDLSFDDGDFGGPTELMSFGDPRPGANLPDAFDPVSSLQEEVEVTAEPEAEELEPAHTQMSDPAEEAAAAEAPQPEAAPAHRTMPAVGGGNKELEGRIRELEAALRAKDAEFADRLLEESTRAKEGIELKKKLTQLDKSLDDERARTARLQEQISTLSKELHEAQQTAAGAASKISELEEKVVELNGRLTSSDEELQALRSSGNRSEQALRERESSISNLVNTQRAIAAVLDDAVTLLNQTAN